MKDGTIPLCLILLLQTIKIKYKIVKIGPNSMCHHLEFRGVKYIKYFTYNVILYEFITSKYIITTEPRRGTVY